MNDRFGVAATAGSLTENLMIDDHRSSLFRINRRAYTSREVLELEQERVFDRCWLFVGHDSELCAPGDFRSRKIAGRPVIFVRGRDGKIRVLLNTCRHRGATVCRQNSGNANTFRCFYHGWAYGNEGRLIGIPGEDAYGEAFRRDELGLMSAPRTESYRGFVFVTFNPEAESLTDYLAGAREYLDIFSDYGEQGMEIVEGSQEYSMRANWKLLVENSYDNSHPFTTHARYNSQFLKSLGIKIPESFNPTLAREEIRSGPEERSLGNGHALFFYPLTATRFDVLGKIAERELQTRRQRLETRFGADRARRVMDGIGNMVIFPNFTLVDGFHGLRVVYPVSSDYSEITSWVMLPKEDDDELRAKHLTNYLSFLGPGGFGTPDDVEALEACQRGFAARGVEWSELSRGMQRERPLITDEFTLRTFYRKWFAVMTETPAPIDFSDHDGAD